MSQINPLLNFTPPRDKDCYLEQFALSVVDYTAKYNNSRHTAYSPQNLSGKYSKYPAYGDYPETFCMRCYGNWWKKGKGYAKPYMPQDLDPLGADDYITLRFDCAVLPENVAVYETYNPGAVVRIWGRMENYSWHLLWKGMPQKVPQDPRKFDPPIRKINYYINEIRLELNCSKLTHNACIDAVLLTGYKPKSYLLSQLFTFMDEKVKESQKALSIPKPNSQDDIYGPDWFETLPSEIVIQIFGYLDLRSLINCSYVNKKWYQIATDSVFYRNISLRKYWSQVDASTLNSLREKTKGSLRKLDLSWCGNSDKYFAGALKLLFTESCENLTHLTLNNSYNVDSEHVELISHCCDIVDLRLRNLMARDFTPLASLTNLVAIDLYGSAINDEQFCKILKSNPNLKHIIVDLCERLVDLDVVVATVAQFNRQLVSWSSWKGSLYVGVALFAKCSYLEELDLGWCLMFAHPEPLEKIANSCLNLRKLIISGWRTVDDRALLPIINNCKQLEHLDLLGIRNISSNIIEIALMTLPNLKLLELSYCDGIPQDMIPIWRRTYPSVQIQRSCLNDTAEYFD